MQIIRISKNPAGATVARLTISKSSNGRVRTNFKVEGPMTGFMEQGECENAEEAERIAVAQASQRQAACLIIEDQSSHSK